MPSLDHQQQIYCCLLVNLSLGQVKMSCMKTKCLSQDVRPVETTESEVQDLLGATEVVWALNYPQLIV